MHKLVLALWVSIFSMLLHAQSQVPDTTPVPYLDKDEMVSYLSRIGYNNPEQVAEALMRVAKLYDFDEGARLSNPVAIVLHGPEVSIFQRNNYPDYKDIVDLAARLSALGILDIRVCETRLGLMGADKESVYPFVQTVPFGPAEIDRLLNEENYVYF